MAVKINHYRLREELVRAREKLNKLDRLEAFLGKTTWLSQTEKELVQRALQGIRSQINTQIIEVYQEIEDN